MKPAPPGLRRALSPLLLALLGLAPVGCAPEVTLCQVDGAKYENSPNGTLEVWINPILYVRVYNDELFETTRVNMTVFNGSQVIVPSTAMHFYNFTTDPGGTSICYRDRSSMMSGIKVLSNHPRTAPLALSVKVDITDTSGSSRSYTLPVGLIRYVQEPMPSFSCSPTRCGR